MSRGQESGFSQRKFSSVALNGIRKKEKDLVIVWSLETVYQLARFERLSRGDEMSKYSFDLKAGKRVDGETLGRNDRYCQENEYRVIEE